MGEYRQKFEEFTGCNTIYYNVLVRCLKGENGYQKKSISEKFYKVGRSLGMIHNAIDRFPRVDNYDLLCEKLTGIEPQSFIDEEYFSEKTLYKINDLLDSI